MNAGLRVLAAALLATAPAAFAGGFYKCVQDGATVYQASPCADGSSGGAVDLAPINSMGDAPKRARPAAPRAERLPAAPPGKPAVQPLAAMDGWYTGIAGYREALREQERTGAPLLLYFYTDWCPYCRHFSTRVLPETTVVRAVSSYIKVQVNTEAGAEEDSLFRRLGGSGIPYVLAQDAERRMFRVRGTGDAKAFVAAVTPPKTRRR